MPTNLLPVIASQAKHILTSIKLGGAYKPEKSAFYTTFARQLCDDTQVFDLELDLVSCMTVTPGHSTLGLSDSRSFYPSAG